MALCEDFESTRASLLHCTFIPSLEVGVAELISKENHCSTMKMQSPDMVVVAASYGASKSPIPLSGHSTSQSSSKTYFCKYWRHPGQSVPEHCKLQHKMQLRAPFEQSAAIAPSTSSTPESSNENQSQSTTLTAAYVKALCHQVLS